MEDINLQNSGTAQEWANGGAPDKLIQNILALDMLVCVPDVISLSETQGASIPLAAQAYDKVGERFGLVWLRKQSKRLPINSHWQKLAMGALLEDFLDQQRYVSKGVLKIAKEANNDNIDAALESWVEGNLHSVQKTDRLLAEYRESAGSPDLAMLTVAARMYRTMTQ